MVHFSWRCDNNVFFWNDAAVNYFWTILAIAIGAIVSTQPRGPIVFLILRTDGSVMVCDDFRRGALKNAYFATGSNLRQIVHKLYEKFNHLFTFIDRIQDTALDKEYNQTCFTLLQILYLGCPFKDSGAGQSGQSLNSAYFL